MHNNTHSYGITYKVSLALVVGTLEDGAVIPAIKNVTSMTFVARQENF